MNRIKNLVFEGGGVKGAAYLGIRQVLDERDMMPDIIRIAGTSAGAINALLVALNYNLEDTREIVMGLDFKTLMDDSFGVIRDIHRLLNEFGWHKGDAFMEWLGAIISQQAGKEDATFRDFKSMGFRDLYLIGANLSTGYSEIFSVEHTPDMPVLIAVRISMSIPLFFTAVRHENSLYVDGGLFRNYPIRIFDKERYMVNNGSNRPICNDETLGFRLDSKEEIAIFRKGMAIPHDEINDFWDFAVTLMKAIMNVQNSSHLESEDWRRTVYIDTLGVSAIDFDLSDDMKNKLVQSGIKGMRRYFINQMEV